MVFKTPKTTYIGLTNRSSIRPNAITKLALAARFYDFNKTHPS